MVRSGQLGLVRSGQLGSGQVWPVRYGQVWPVRSGEVWPVGVWSGLASQRDRPAPTSFLRAELRRDRILKRQSEGTLI